MTDSSGSGSTGAGDEPCSTPRRTRGRAPSADPFGNVLPDRTRDEEAEGWSEARSDPDEHLWREVPPHHR